VFARVSSLNRGERQYLKMFLNIAGSAPATGLTEDDEIDVNFYGWTRHQPRKHNRSSPTTCERAEFEISDQDGGGAAPTRMQRART
jgi:hypothetical protein